MKKTCRFSAAMTCAAALVFLFPGSVHAQDNTTKDFLPPVVFRAAGPTVNSIQGSVDAYRAALGEPNNGNAAGVQSGRREINWDGGNPNNQATATAANPFTGFQNTRGALFTTPDGIGFVQAPPAGLAVLFNNSNYGTIFSAFSLSRLFSAIGSNVTDVRFFVPGSGGAVPATTSGFGALFTDVDQPKGTGPGGKHANRRSSTFMEYFDAEGELLFSGFAPNSPGDGAFSFLGIVFKDARIARVRITSGNVAPGPDDAGELDVVMMDDFLYGEPQRIP